MSSLALYFFLILSKACFEVLVVDAAHDVAEHVDQPAVGVVGEPLVAGRVGEADDRLVVQAEVEDRVHHARHRARPRRCGPRPSSGSCVSPNFLPSSFSSMATFLATSSIKPAGSLRPLL